MNYKTIETLAYVQLDLSESGVECGLKRARGIVVGWRLR